MEIEFSGTVLPHEMGLQRAGLCEDAEIGILGVEEFREYQAETRRLDLIQATKDGRSQEVEQICKLDPQRVNSKNEVTNEWSHAQLLMQLVSWAIIPRCITLQWQTTAKLQLSSRRLEL